MDLLATSLLHARCILVFGSTPPRPTAASLIKHSSKTPLHHPARLFNSEFTALCSSCILDGTRPWYTEANISSAPNTTGRAYTLFPLSNGTDISVHKACLYMMKGQFRYALGRFMWRTLFHTTGGHAGWSKDLRTPLICEPSWQLEPLYSRRHATFKTLSEVFDEIATALTNDFRSTGLGRATGIQMDRGRTRSSRRS
ncbi:hypothetical protein B0T25DRAFT_535982 [Lasiosphaeria hispida]|uniref:Uncharacterized protein n=1 Tax=Lasiosphaeria hispida TaxID=260671 RepID=A0AAJ0HSE7_9PEZI|nr:hypothetical protein B0T25DRAFT_535982 [Lasiosphaeria hispida]